MALTTRQIRGVDPVQLDSMISGPQSRHCIYIRVEYSLGKVSGALDHALSLFLRRAITTNPLKS